jgi:hypothetical protein
MAEPLPEEFTLLSKWMRRYEKVHHVGELLSENEEHVWGDFLAWAAKTAPKRELVKLMAEVDAWRGRSRRGERKE